MGDLKEQNLDLGLFGVSSRDTNVLLLTSSAGNGVQHSQKLVRIEESQALPCVYSVINQEWAQQPCLTSPLGLESETPEAG